MLKALELQGFKSFADKTRFEFPDGVTVVVGPNGSGKSNVIDGIRWVLGEQSAKSLRGSDMSDVIFKGSGTGQRRQANTAEVTIVFDNSGQLLPLDVPEVRVTRRVYRSGEGEYLINDETCRLRDVRDLFRGTGVGADAYSLIEQGKVDTLLQASPKERRAIFEEAAGISRFKAKKVESQRRLDRVEQNLLRLSDIVDEVDRRLKSLRNQATKARRYREYTERLKELRTHISLTDFLTITEESSGIESQLAALTNQITSLQTGCEQTDVDTSAIDQRMEAIKLETRQVSEQVSQLREHIAEIETTSKMQRQSLDELQRESARCRHKLVAVNSRAGDMKSQLEAAKIECDQVEQAHAEVETRAEELNAKMQAISEELTAKQESERRQREKHTEQMRSIAQLNSQLGSLESELSLAKSSIARDQERGDELAAQLRAAATSAETLSAEESELKKKLTEANEKTSEARTARDEFSLRVTELTEELATCKEQRVAATERSNVLEEVERRLEGIGAGTKDLLAKAQSGAAGPISEIRGMVADLIEVKVEMAPLVDAAIGERAQYIVVSGHRLMRAIADSSMQLRGRVGIISLATLRADRTERDAKLATEEGVLGLATDFVVTEPTYDELMDHLLGNTWFVRSADVALRLRESMRNTDWRFVTSTGEVLEADGTFFGGPRLSSGGLVSRRSELRSLQTQVTKLAERENLLTSELRQWQEKKDASEKELREWDGIRNKANDEFAEIHANAEAARQMLSQLNSSQKSLESGIAELQLRETDILSKQSDAIEGLSSLETLVSTLESSLGDDRQSVHALRSQHKDLEQQATTTKIELAKVEQRLETLRVQAQRYEQDNDDRAKAVQDIHVQLDQCDSRFVETTQAVLSGSSESAECYLRLQDFEQQLTKFRSEEDEISTERADKTAEARGWREQLHKLQQSEQALQIHAGELRLKKESLSERLRDDYGIELSELVTELQTRPFASENADADQIETAEQAEPETEQEAIAVSDESDQHQDPDLEDSESTEPDSQEDQAKAAQTEPEAVDPEASESETVDEEQPATTAHDDARKVMSQLTEEHDREDVESEIGALRRKINNIGAVNMESLAELDDLESRYGELSEQYRDLVKAKETLERIIQRINVDSRQMFEETLEVIRENFQALFRRAFGGGQADIVVEEDVDILDAGIDIIATPPGKRSLNISLLSGGERALTAVTLLLAIFRHRPSPFCILDEVDGPLDEANIGRFVDVLKEFLATTKVVIVTHSKKTMSAATTLYGVTMQESGVSKRVSVQFNDVREDGSIRKGAGEGGSREDEDAA